MSCPACGGKRESCAHCDGVGTIEIRECPFRLIEPKHSHAIIAALQMENGILPAPGAWLDQAATFVDAWPALANEIGHWRQKAHERANKVK